MKRYRFTRAWAQGTAALGVAFVVVGLVAGGIAAVAPSSWFDNSPPGPDWKPTEREALMKAYPRLYRPLPAGNLLVIRLSAVIVLPLIGLAMGTPLVIIGQLILIFIDQRQLLARQRGLLEKIHGRLESWEEARAGHRDDGGLAERLRR